MRIEEVWDSWLEYDEDGFVSGIREDAPDDVKAAYSEYLSELEKMKKSGCIPK